MKSNSGLIPVEVSWINSLPILLVRCTGLIVSSAFTDLTVRYTGKFCSPSLLLFCPYLSCFNIKWR